MRRARSAPFVSAKEGGARCRTRTVGSGLGRAGGRLADVGRAGEWKHDMRDRQNEVEG